MAVVAERQEEQLLAQALNLAQRQKALGELAALAEAAGVAVVITMRP